MSNSKIIEDLTAYLTDLISKTDLVLLDSIKALKESLLDLNTTRQDLPDITTVTSSNITSVILQYSEYGKFYEDLHNLIDAVSGINLNIFPISTSRKADLYSKIDSIKMKFTKEHQKYKLDNDDYLGNFVNKIVELITAKKVPSEIISLIDALYQSYITNQYSIDVYVSVMKELLTYYVENKPVYFQILEYVELSKDVSLAYQTKTNRPRLKHSKNINPIPSRFSLVPASDLLPLNQLLQLILVDEPISLSVSTVTTQDLHKICTKLKKVGFILFNKLVQNPVEFSISSLINSDGLESQPDTYGITQKTIDRFKTILPQKSGKKLFEFSFEIIHSSVDNIDSIEKFYIIETLNNSSYRCMLPWMYTKNRFYVNKFQINNILSHKKLAVNRINNYQSHCSKVASSNMFLDKSLDLEYIDHQKVYIDSSDIKYSLVDLLIEKVVSIVKTKFSKKIKSSVDILHILHDTDLTDHFVKSVVFLYKKGTNLDDLTGFSGGAFKYNELLASFIVNLQLNSRRFSRELHNGYVRDPLPDKMFDINSVNEQTAVTDKCMEKIKSIINSSVDLIIKLDDNIYTNLNYKYLILNF